ncbi:MAG: 4-hydroxyphenylacetate 3-monooxygenase, oxygenase component [Dehalococcoidia bacterium]
MALRTGKQFLEGIRDAREVWLEGERVSDVTTHPKLARMAQTLAGVYDLQNDPKLRDEMTFASPSSGEPVALSYIIPETQDDLLRRRRALEIVADSHHGMLGRTPDYVNVQVTAARMAAVEYGANQPWLGENLIKYHEYIRENDLCLTHAFGHPQVNRGAALTEQPDPYIPTGIVETNDDGIIVRGAKLLATLAPFADELFCPPYRMARPDEAMFCLGFSVPMSAPGLKFICRESYDHGESVYDHPLSGQYEEIDALAVFDNVLVPWDRVFAYNDVDLHNRLITTSTMWRQHMQHVMVKDIAKMEFIVGMAHELTEAIGIGGFAHIQEKMAELIDTLETVRSYLRAAEADAGPGVGEGIWLAPQPCIALRHSWPDMYDRVVAILQQMAAGGLMLTPTEADMASDARPMIDKYFQGANIAAYDRVKLFRTIWDLIGSQFGSRSTLYERFFNGDVVRLRQARYQTYDYSKAVQSYQAFVAETEKVT